jgi:hypothetical protein
VIENEKIINLMVAFNAMSRTKNNCQMKKCFVFTVFLILFAGSIQSQVDEVYTGTLKKSDSTRKKPKRDLDWMKKVTYGGNLQLQLGTFTFVYMSPTIGYQITPKLNVGVGIIYNYISINYGGSYGKVSQSVFGGHSYIRYFINEGFYLQGQYDQLRQPDVFSINPDQKKWVEYAMAGFGFRKPIGDKVGLNLTVLYNLTPNVLSIYPSRFIFQFGIMGTF